MYDVVYIVIYVCRLGCTYACRSVRQANAQTNRGPDFRRDLFEVVTWHSYPYVFICRGHAKGHDNGTALAGGWEGESGRI